MEPLPRNKKYSEISPDIVWDDLGDDYEIIAVVFPDNDIREGVYELFDAPVHFVKDLLAIDDVKYFKKVKEV